MFLQKKRELLGRCQIVESLLRRDETSEVEEMLTSYFDEGKSGESLLTRQVEAARGCRLITSRGNGFLVRGNSNEGFLSGFSEQ